MNETHGTWVRGFERRGGPKHPQLHNEMAKASPWDNWPVRPYGNGNAIEEVDGQPYNLPDLFQNEVVKLARTEK